jgi:hypothetical protein
VKTLPPLDNCEIITFHGPPGAEIVPQIGWRRLQNLKYTADSELELDRLTSRPRYSNTGSDEANMTAEGSKRMIIGSLAAAGVVALLSVLDLIMGIPFAGFSVLMDILFIVAAALVAFLAWDAYKDLR